MQDVEEQLTKTAVKPRSAVEVPTMVMRCARQRNFANFAKVDVDKHVEFDKRPASRFHANCLQFQSPRSLRLKG